MAATSAADYIQVANVAYISQMCQSQFLLISSPHVVHDKFFPAASAILVLYDHGQYNYVLYVIMLWSLIGYLAITFDREVRVWA